MFVFEFLPLQTGQGTQFHLYDGVSLDFGQIKAFHQGLLCDLYRFAGADDLNHFIDMIECDQ